MYFITTSINLTTVARKHFNEYNYVIKPRQSRQEAPHFLRNTKACIPFLFEEGHFALPADLHISDSEIAEHF